MMDPKRIAAHKDIIFMREPEEAKYMGVILLPESGDEIRECDFGIATACGPDCKVTKVGSYVIYFRPMLQGLWGKNGAVIAEKDIWGIADDPYREDIEKRAEAKVIEGQAAKHLLELRKGGKLSEDLGRCPECKAPGVHAEGREDGFTSCSNGHKYRHDQRVYPDVIQ